MSSNVRMKIVFHNTKNVSTLSIYSSYDISTIHSLYSYANQRNLLHLTLCNSNWEIQDHASREDLLARVSLRFQSYAICTCRNFPILAYLWLKVSRVEPKITGIRNCNEALNGCWYENNYTRKIVSLKVWYFANSTNNFC